MLAFLTKHPKAGLSQGVGQARARLRRDALWLQGYAEHHIKLARQRLKPSRMAQAWAWYYRSDTQCEANHEGGWTSVNPAGYYGRFQMDVAFQNETPFGRAMYARYGTANHWPPWAQVYHAFEVWSYSGWGRWPPYAKYCA